jgi:hypothetical protein
MNALLVWYVIGKRGRERGERREGEGRENTEMEISERVSINT